MVVSRSEMPCSRPGRRASRRSPDAHCCCTCRAAGEKIAHLERESRLLDEVGRRDAVVRDARIDSDAERFGLRHAVDGQLSLGTCPAPRAAPAHRIRRRLLRHRRLRAPARVAKVPHEAVHADLRRQRGRADCRLGGRPPRPPARFPPAYCCRTAPSCRPRRRCPASPAGRRLRGNSRCARRPADTRASRAGPTTGT